MKISKKEKKKMKKALIIVGIVIALIILIIAIFAGTNNRAISLEEQIYKADSDIQIQEKRRTDLILNLVDCVKEYDKHEAEVIQATVEARNESQTKVDSVSTMIQAVAEAYPELKASENYKELMNELSITENMIAEHRSSYNSQIRAYNKYVRKFPHKQILNMMGYEYIDFKYLEYSEEERQSLNNLFGD